jgi:hypothetical protein
MPKHEGHATVASRAPQCWHSVESLDTEAPHIGQFNVSAEGFMSQPSRIVSAAAG